MKKNVLILFLCFSSILTFAQDKNVNSGVALTAERFPVFPKCESLEGKTLENCFYNEVQAREAFDIADELMNFRYTWPEGETNWLKQNVFVLKQMEQNIDSLNL